MHSGCPTVEDPATPRSGVALNPHPGTPRPPSHLCPQSSSSHTDEGTVRKAPGGTFPTRHVGAQSRVGVPQAWSPPGGHLGAQETNPTASYNRVPAACDHAADGQPGACWHRQTRRWAHQASPCLSKHQEPETVGCRTGAGHVPEPRQLKIPTPEGARLERRPEFLPAPWPLPGSSFQGWRGLRHN